MAEAQLADPADLESQHKDYIETINQEIADLKREKKQKTKEQGEAFIDGDSDLANSLAHECIDITAQISQRESAIEAARVRHKENVQVMDTKRQQLIQEQLKDLRKKQLKLAKVIDEEATALDTKIGQLIELEREAGRLGSRAGDSRPGLLRFPRVLSQFVVGQFPNLWKVAATGRPRSIHMAWSGASRAGSSLTKIYENK